jgi:AraC-like DNA-binding protein
LKESSAAGGVGNVAQRVEVKTVRREIINRQRWEALAETAQFSARELARLCDLSLRQLQREFRRELDCSPRAWLNERRMIAARERLRSGVPVKRVAFELGFKHVSHFCMWFKAENGVTATAFVSSTPRPKGVVSRAPDFSRSSSSCARSSRTKTKSQREQVECVISGRHSGAGKY